MMDAKYWIAKYPFLTIKDNSVYPWLRINSTNWHWLSDLPCGWVKSFGEKMCDELLCALDKYVDDFIIFQVKEKYGSIRMYWRWDDREYTEDEVREINSLSKIIDRVLKRYEEISYHTCVKCGEPATHYSEGWVLPFCSTCFEVGLYD